MNEITCYYCGFKFAYSGEKYRDIYCPNCRVMNSIYDPDKILTEPEGSESEELDMIDYNAEKYQGKFVYLPVVGEEAEFDIAEINEVKSDNAKFNFKERTPVMANGEPVVDDDGEPVYKDKDLGYHIEAKLKNGKVLSITSMSAFIQVFKKHEIQDGEKIKVFHKDRGVWEVEKL